MGKHKHNKTKKGGLYTTPPPVQSNYGQDNLFTPPAYSAPQAPSVQNNIQDKFKETDDKATKAVTDGVKNISQTVANVANPVVEPVKGFFGNLWDKAKKLVKQPETHETIGSSMGVQPAVGGKKRRGGGGFRPSQDYGIATSGAPVNGIKTVNANSYIGGKKSKRGKRKGSRKSRKSHKKK